MRKLLSYVKPYWLLVLLGPLLMFLEVFTELWQPRLMARIVDTGIAQGDIPYILRTGGVMLLVALAGMIFGLGSIVASSYASQRYGADLRERVYYKVQGLSYANLDKFRTGAIITRLTSDVTQMQQLVMIMMRMLVRAPMLWIGSLVMMVSMSPSLSVVLLAAVPLLFAIMMIIQAKGIPLFRKVQKRLDRVNTVMQENLAGVRAIRAFGRTQFEGQRFTRDNDELQNASIIANRTMGLLDPLMTLGINLAIVAVVLVGGRLINTTTLSNRPSLAVGQIMAFISYMTQILFALIRTGVLINALARSKASADRINEIMDTAADIVPATSPEGKVVTQGRVEFCDVSFRYASTSGGAVLQNISFVVEAGETVAITGATGSGKSTLVSLLPRMYDVTAGSILIDGIDVRDYDVETLRGSMGLVMQDTMLFSGSVADNLRWGRTDADDEEIQGAAKAAQADDFVAALPNGYSASLGQRGTSLSGGQKQRLAIARALVRKPLILILDDATSAVDMGTEARIQQSLREINWPCTVFIVAQRISTVMDADRIIVLDNGRIDGMGSHDELLRSNIIYQEIVRSQFGHEAV